jgi:hypothetical protein
MGGYLPVSFLEVSLTRKWPPMSEMLKSIPSDQRHKIPPEMLKKMEEEKNE